MGYLARQFKYLINDQVSSTLPAYLHSLRNDYFKLTDEFRSSSSSLQLLLSWSVRAFRRVVSTSNRADNLSIVSLSLTHSLESCSN